MKLVVKIVGLFVLAIIIAILCGSGHVIMFISNYRLDLSLATLLLCVLIIYVILYYAFVFWSGIYHIPDSIRHYRQRTSLSKSYSYFNLAATDYFVGEYNNAYNNALKSLSQHIPVNNKFPVLLLALDTIHLMDNNDKTSSIKLDSLLNKFPDNEEQNYIYNELSMINKTKNNRFYSEILTKLARRNHGPTASPV